MGPKDARRGRKDFDVANQVLCNDRVFDHVAWVETRDYISVFGVGMQARARAREKKAKGTRLGPGLGPGLGPELGPGGTTKHDFAAARKICLPGAPHRLIAHIRA